LYIYILHLLFHPHLVGSSQPTAATAFGPLHFTTSSKPVSEFHTHPHTILSLGFLYTPGCFIPDRLVFLGSCTSDKAVSRFQDHLSLLLARIWCKSDQVLVHWTFGRQIHCVRLLPRFICIGGAATGTLLSHLHARRFLLTPILPRLLGSIVRVPHRFALRDPSALSFRGFPGHPVRQFGPPTGPRSITTSHTTSTTPDLKGLRYLGGFFYKQQACPPSLCPRSRPGVTSPCSRQRLACSGSCSTSASPPQHFSSSLRFVSRHNSGGTVTREEASLVWWALA
jgi:hypothetical protein